jgi:phosphate:Na+ symporter
MVEEIFDFWKFLAGIGIFLWGMNQLEMSIKAIGGKSLKKLLQKSTDTSVKGVLVGALITAILQSSSLVTLMVLAFLGAGVLNLRNSIGIILGANLGTTVTAWIVATLGFKLSVAEFSLPFLGIGSLLYLFTSTRPILRNIGLFGVGFGLLFMGLDFMKTSIEAVAEQVDLSMFHTYGLWVYLLIGIVVTALIQSSSAMVVIILSAMGAGVIELTEGAVLIIGANIGTTVTVGLGALKGSADKKRLALAHFLFNLITGLLIFAFIKPLVHFTMKFFSISDPLMELVLLNTMINLIGIFLFFPFIPAVERWLKHRFQGGATPGIFLFSRNVNPAVPEAAMQALEKDLQTAFDKTLDFIGGVWGQEQKAQGVWKRIIGQPVDLLQQYKEIKELEDELTRYHILLQEENLTPDEANKLTSMMLALRTMVYAAKDIKDVLHNIRDIEDGEDPLALRISMEMKAYTFKFFDEMRSYLSGMEVGEEIPDWLSKNEHKYKQWISSIYSQIKQHHPDFPISTLTNVIKQVISCLDNIGSAVIHWKHMKKDVIDDKHELQNPSV